MNKSHESQPSPACPERLVTQGLGQDICHHELGGAVLHDHLPTLDPIPHEVMDHIDVLGPHRPQGILDLADGTFPG